MSRQWNRRKPLKCAYPGCRKKLAYRLFAKWPWDTQLAYSCLPHMPRVIDALQNLRSGEAPPDSIEQQRFLM